MTPFTNNQKLIAFRQHQVKIKNVYLFKKKKIKTSLISFAQIYRAAQKTWVALHLWIFQRITKTQHETTFASLGSQLAEFMLEGEKLVWDGNPFGR